MACEIARVTRLIILVQIGPAALNDPQHFVPVKIGQGAQEKVGRRDKVGIENGNELFFSAVERSLQGAGFEPVCDFPRRNSSIWKCFSLYSATT